MLAFDVVDGAHFRARLFSLFVMLLGGPHDDGGMREM
jgi:hypothetical protein